MERFFNFINKHELDLNDFKSCVEDAYNYYEENYSFDEYFHEETLKKVYNGHFECIMEGDNDDLNVKLALKIYKPTPMYIDSVSEKLNYDKIRKFLKKKETKVSLSNLKGKVRKDLTHVVELTIKDCEDLILPSLPSCVVLLCAGNGITKLPELPKCKFLDCSSNKLTELPELPVCEDLNCNSNKIEKLPDLPECAELHCSNNKLKKLPDLSECSVLHCSSNKLKTLPDLPVCEMLDCSDNELKTLPDLPVCEELDCGYNELKTLPDLPVCKLLICNNNYITELPFMPKVKRIYCEYNQLKLIPNLISKKLKVLHMRNQSDYFDCDAILNNHPNLTDLECDVAKKIKTMFSSVSRPVRNYSENSAVLEDISFRNRDFGRRYF